jgi:phosphoribosylformylglycinamidine (FGAM) synthase-like enzyme
MEDSPVHFQWVPLLNFVTDHQRSGEGYWPLFVSEKDVWCVATRGEDDYEPRPAPLPPVMNVALRSQAQYGDSPESQLFLDRLLAQQTRLCAQLGLPASAFRTVTDGDLDKAVKKVENAHDKKLADMFRKLLETGKIEKALGGAALAFQSMTARLMIRMAAALGMRTLEARLEDLFNPAANELAEPTRRELSASETLFPQATVRGSPKVEQHISSPKKVEAVKEIGTKSGSGGPVNPFAKKRANDENTDSGNKMARNA